MRTFGEIVRYHIEKRRHNQSRARHGGLPGRSDCHRGFTIVPLHNVPKRRCRLKSS
jgi:hypothetical protein